MTVKFDTDWAKLGLNETDLMRLQLELLINPKSGKVIRGTGGIRKIRFAMPKRGKSGSARVIYIDFYDCGKLFLLTAYAKNEKDNLSDSERDSLKKLTGLIKAELESRQKDERI